MTRLGVVIEEGAEKAVAGERDKLVPRQIERIGDGGVIGVHIAAEIAWVVAVHGGEKPGVQHRLERMRGHVADDAKLEIGKRAHGQAHRVVGEPRDEGFVLEAAIAVIDAIDAQQIERLADIFGRPFLTGMGDEAQAEVAGAGEDALELGGWVADFGRIEADTVDPVEPPSISFSLRYSFS